MNQKQQAAKAVINQLAIELLALLNQEKPLTEWDVSKIRDINNQINYEINDLNDYEELLAIAQQASDR